ncbi:MAG TPA: prepilin peptidase [Atribacterota bacterium]|nr:prepilin peptidase [Atribacterota bacterium]
MTYIFTGLIIFIIGLVIGSFSNVCIYRIPRNESIVFPGSHCPGCNQLIKWYDNIPLFSYLFLKGKCRNCKINISWQYPLVESLTGFIYFFLFYFYGLQILTLAYMLFSSVLIIITFIDLKEKIIPDVLSIPFLALGFLFSFLRQDFSPLDSLLGVLAGGGSLFLIAVLGSFFFKKEAMGGGDIKLAAMTGAFLGWQSTLLALFLGFFIGSVTGIIILMRNKNKLSDTALPFGPFIAVGSIITLFLGEFIINWYF